MENGRGEENARLTHFSTSWKGHEVGQDVVT